ncbi:MAG: glutamine--tRNA ligase/YqeY domain fusion protein [Spirochaetaceae bacterium]|nr:MAG: glutamine--tRNA ligase/YqeY domain fusion protein [Spirochaetaceae bacterium]
MLESALPSQAVIREKQSIDTTILVTIKVENEPVGSENRTPEGKKNSFDFIRAIINEDIRNNKRGGRVHTRFPPEPNGYLHIGHAKSICLNFGIAAEYSGLCNLRFDDTNPTKEEVEYVDSIKEDVRWLGFDWDDREYYASDYFQQLHDFAVRLIKGGKAYVDSLTAEEIREYRGTLTEPGKNSPFRDRSVEENLELFEGMRSGKFKEGEHVLRAKIDMGSPNMNMRDPTIYRIRYAPHHRTGSTWCIYPMYDYAHPLSDAIEGISHSICTLEFENNRPLYDWFIAQLDFKEPPQQIEFARLNLSHTIMSKRKLLQLVQEAVVSGWDDPRMPTLSGMRRRGYTAEAIRAFAERVGVSKTNSTVDLSFLEYFIREDLNKRAPRVMAVLRPLKLIIENYPEGEFEELEAENNPEDPAAGSRTLPFGRVLYIEQEDFREDPPKKYFRLSPGREVRLKHAYYVTCTGVAKDERTGEILEVHCSYDPDTRGGWSEDGRKIRGTLHWVSAAHALDAEIRLYDVLFSRENPDEVGDFKDALNPNSLEVLKDAKVEPSLNGTEPGARYQFLRQGYFCVDPDSRENRLVFNQTVTLRDTWAKIEKSLQGGEQEGD